jgi:hypothetical protein
MRDPIATTHVSGSPQPDFPHSLQDFCTGAEPLFFKAVSRAKIRYEMMRRSAIDTPRQHVRFGQFPAAVNGAKIYLPASRSLRPAKRKALKSSPAPFPPL